MIKLFLFFDIFLDAYKSRIYNFIVIDFYYKNSREEILISLLFYMFPFVCVCKCVGGVCESVFVLYDS
jgi:hypothetical protein